MGNRVEVKFKKDYVASRGNAISGAKGEVKTFPQSDDLDLCIKSGIVTKVRDVKPKKAAKKTRGKAGSREKATSDKDKENS